MPVAFSTFDISVDCDWQPEGMGYDTLKAAKQAARAHIRTCLWCQVNGLTITLASVAHGKQEAA